jgi:hypothetical protein
VPACFLGHGNCRKLLKIRPGGLLNAFEARWALTLLDHAMKVLRQEYVSRGKELVFNTLKAYARIGESSPEASYEKAVFGLPPLVNVCIAFLNGLPTDDWPIWRHKNRIACVARQWRIAMASG